MSNPSTTGPTDRREILIELNRLMAEELEAFLRYFQVRYRLRGTDRLVADRFFDGALKETLEHAEMIARRIRALGEVPQLRINLSVGGGPISLTEALQETLLVEQQALDAYRELLPRVAGDPVLEDFLRAQIAIESEHVQEVASLLG